MLLYALILLNMLVAGEEIMAMLFNILVSLERLDKQVS